MATRESPGPFRADQLRPGDPYELSNGRLIPCLPESGRAGRAASVGGGVLASDPADQDVGLDVGFSPCPEMLRAPDIAVGEIPDQPGWVEGVPLLAVDYADTGQDEEDLQIKIRELLSAGTRYFWVVRLTSTPRVETYQPGEDVRTFHSGEQLTAPGVLENPLPVEALYDGEAARKVIFRNLLQRQGKLASKRTAPRSRLNVQHPDPTLKAAPVELIPIRTDADGVIRIAETRVTLDTVVDNFMTGASPEEIAQDFPVLRLDDVYAVLTYYLRHRDEVDSYLRERCERGEAIRAEIEARSSQTGLRDRLLARLGQERRAAMVSRTR